MKGRSTRSYLGRRREQKVNWASPYIKSIEKRTEAFAELNAAHHFLFDAHLKKGSSEVDFVVMGINPGETPFDLRNSPEKTQETSDFDFHDSDGRSRSSSRWAKLAKEILQTDSVVLTELFFWSSKDSAQFKERYGDLRSSPHTSFCKELNIKLIQHYKPKAVIFTGLSVHKIVAEMYKLEFVQTHRAENSHRLIEQYSLQDRPWIFTKHWTASFGFSKLQRIELTQKIADICATPRSSRTL